MREQHCSICHSHSILCAYTSYSAVITKLKIQNISPRDCHTQAPKPESACAATSLKFCQKPYLSLFTFLTLCPSPLPPLETVWSSCFEAPKQKKMRTTYLHNLEVCVFLLRTTSLLNKTILSIQEIYLIARSHLLVQVEVYLLAQRSCLLFNGILLVTDKSLVKCNTNTVAVAFEMLIDQQGCDNVSISLQLSILCNGE